MLRKLFMPPQEELEMNSFVSAIKGHIPDRVPVWFMRQAGRYLPGYRKMRKLESIKEICLSPQLSVELTSEPIQTIDLDAAIVFSDIMLPTEALGFKLEFRKGVGPIVENAFRFNSNLDGIIAYDRQNDRYPIDETIKLFKETNPGIPIIGFSGGPVTILSYLLNGSPDRDMSFTKNVLLREPNKFKELMTLISQMIIEYCKIQIRAGADAIQIFDSWAGFFSPYSFKRHISPFLFEIVDELRNPSTPLIYFSTGTSGILTELKEFQFDFLSVDWRTRLSNVRKIVGSEVGLQGNLDPSLAAHDEKHALTETKEILKDIDFNNRYVFNLGHGVLPNTDPDTLKKIVDIVHSAK